MGGEGKSDAESFVHSMKTKHKRTGCYLTETFVLIGIKGQHPSFTITTEVLKLIKRKKI